MPRKKSDVLVLEEQKKQPKKSEPKRRMLSPSQIKTFEECPRKWYYQYVERRPTKKTFALIRGTVVHKVCEQVYTMKVPKEWSYDNLCIELGAYARNLLVVTWEKYKVNKFLDKNEADGKFAETLKMVERFVMHMKWNMEPIYEKTGSVWKAWNWSKPKKTEMHIMDKELGCQGHIDAVVPIDKDQVVLLDYKTGKVWKVPVSKDHEMQMMLYALMYKRKTGETPTHVAVQYLLYGQMANYPVRDDLLQEAENLVNFVHAETKSLEIVDYPCNPGARFCEWCDHNDVCEQGIQRLAKAPYAR